MKYTPRPYQERIISFIKNTPRCCIWAGMGMGKTSATLEVIRQLKDKVGRTLVVAPLRVAKTTWLDEIKKWDDFHDLTARFIDLTDNKSIGTLCDINTINFEMLPKLIKLCGRLWPFQIIVVDESTRLKGFRLRQGTIRARALSTVAHKSLFFIELTGTPAPNGLLDLWGQLWFIDRGDRLGTSYSAYQNRFFVPFSKGYNRQWVDWVPLEGSEKKIKSLVSDVSLSIQPEDYFDVDKPITNVIEIPLPDWMMMQYRRLGRELWLELESGIEVTAQNAGVKTTKLLQYASGAIYYDDYGGNKGYYAIHDEKLNALDSVIEEANGSPVLCAYSYRHELDRIKAKFPYARELDNNPKTIEEWNEGKIRLLVAHPASCGHGLNLQDGGNILVFFSCTWNLEHHDQIIERIGAVRQAQSGHKRPVFVHYLTVKGTLDEAVNIRLATKREIQDILLSRKDLLVGDNE